MPDHGARIKAVETLLREGLGRVGEAEVAEPRMPTTVAEVEALSWSEMKFIFAISYAQAISAFVDQGEDALRSELERWEPEARATVAEHRRGRLSSVRPASGRANSAGLIGAIPITQTSRPLSMSS